MADHQLKVANQQAQSLYASACPAADRREACDALASIAQLSDPGDYMAIAGAIERYFQASDNLPSNDPIGQGDGRMKGGLYDAHDLSKDAAFERGIHLPLSTFSTWLGYVWPQVFESALAIRLSRAVAVFAL